MNSDMMKPNTLEMKCKDRKQGGSKLHPARNLKHEDQKEGDDAQDWPVLV
jgi:hypothetical protein